jgi:uncharacterized protein (TIGR03435 family)
MTESEVSGRMITASSRRVLSTLGLLVVLGGVATAQAPLEFEVVSIKRNTTNTFVAEPATNIAAGRYWLSNVGVGTMVLQGYQVNGVPKLLNLPDWASSERYDVLAKGKARATTNEQQQMWRALLADRLKLQVHYEPRPQKGYRLVFARTDQRLGPQLQPSTLDCAGPQAPIAPRDVEAIAMQRCGWLMFGTAGGPTAESGGTTLASLARLLSGVVVQSVLDGTGLDGQYAVKLHYASARSLLTEALPPATSDAPSVFIAVQEQLGLKLEPATVDVAALVIDHIERPTEN